MCKSDSSKKFIAEDGSELIIDFQGKSTIRSGLYCDCDNWEPGISEVHNQQLFAAIHNMPYTGKVFKFCPWCGERLKVKVA